MGLKVAVQGSAIQVWRVYGLKFTGCQDLGCIGSPKPETPISRIPAAQGAVRGGSTRKVVTRRLPSIWRDSSGYRFRVPVAA